MAIKWKGWTGRRPVKICCVVLIPVLMFISLYGAVGLAKLDNADISLLFADLSKNDYFYDKYVPTTEVQAQMVFWLQSEDNIRCMGCLEWQYKTQTEYNSSGELANVVGEYELASTNQADAWKAGTVPAEGGLGSLQAELMVEQAINRQLNDLSIAKNQLENTPGLYYYITDGIKQFSNVPLYPGTSFFRTQPVYMISEPGKAGEYSRTAYNPHPFSSRFSFYDSNFGANNLSEYIAFSSEAVDRQNDDWKMTQRNFVNQLMIIFIPALFALALFITLLVGAGRRYGGEHGKVAFMAIDRPWLDLSFCILLGYEVFLCIAAFEAISISWRYDGTQRIYAICAALSVFFALPLLWWLMSFAKHCKAGKWWRHTLIYTLLHWSCCRLKRLAKSLWAGFPLTAKAVAICAALLMVTLFCAVTYPPMFGFCLSIGVTVLAMIGLLRYTRKLHLLEQGAKAASGGHYDTPISVTGGELGSIAASINNISEGISAAVAERIKSERLKTELITNVSHDIRTPLTSLITYTELLKTEGLDNERAPEYLEVLIVKAARLKTLTDDLFEASKAASGNIEVLLEKLNLSDFVRQVLGELDERVSASGLDFRLNLPESALVLADGRLLWRVMQNLLSNVFQYAQRGSRVYIDIIPGNGEVRLDIKNISENALNVDPGELTERFKRGDHARTGDGGSGLGLSIAQSFVQLQDGRFMISIDGDLFKATVILPV